MRLPRSTYRLQLNADFRLAHVRLLIDYFQSLGVSDLYLSPLLQAKAGSRHGYDLTDPTRVNPEIGTEQEFEQLAADLRSRGMGLLLDIVPNHMSATEANAWWRDLMEYGPASEYADYFDIDWDSSAAGSGRLLLPFLGQSLDACIGGADLRLVFEDDELRLGYFDRRLPISSSALVQLTEALLQNLRNQLSPSQRQALQELAVEAVQLPDPRDATRATEYRQRSSQLKQRVSALVRDLTRTVPIDRICALSANQLRVLLEDQAYTLFYWVPGGRQINYRRFFDVADLAAVRIERPEVFDVMHECVLRWLANGTITGLRIDHIDGLRDPAAYLGRLQERTSGNDRSFVVVEKILIGDERLPAHWSTQGTTGYEFIGTTNGLFVQPEGWEQLGVAWEATGGTTDFTALLRDKKLHVMRSLFPGELASLSRRLAALMPETSAELLESALSELTAALPVYRTYITDQASSADRQFINESLDAARSRGADATVVEMLRGFMLDPRADELHEFILRWQQFTGPVMAKGFEDTALYNYHRLVSACEVGADPRRAVCTIEQFHLTMRDRQKSWPATLNASSTHDTKRGEDVRARLNVLSEITDEWLQHLERWRGWHRNFKQELDGIETPDSIDELLLYQTLIGTWPLDESDQAGFEDRIAAYMLKAVREAKRRTSWRASDDQYENAITEFTIAVLNRSNHQFRNDLLTLHRKTSFYGALNSLSQLVLKLGAPGIPDLYQGNELWTLALVDPDNRGPVDFERRRSALLDTAPDTARRNWPDGAIKALVSRAGLQLRNDLSELFLKGDYVPVTVAGPRAHNLIAFERRLGEQRALVLAGRFFTELCAPGEWPGTGSWENTTLELQATEWIDPLHQRTIESTAVGELLNGMPGALLYARGGRSSESRIRAAPDITRHATQPAGRPAPHDARAARTRPLQSQTQRARSR
jgi:(1->4)-alpha-D-glucan 1-alpha-D-glucosylmutase